MSIKCTYYPQTYVSPYPMIKTLLCPKSSYEFILPLQLQKHAMFNGMTKLHTSESCGFPGRESPPCVL